MDNGATETSVEKGTRDQIVPTDDMEFIYDPLDTDLNAIRLLTLMSEDTEVVHCTLEHVSLINPPEYVALSYCWGDPAINKYIKINGITVQITSNLESALRQLRAKGYVRFWVDAVCINQKDKTEQSQQLLWMGSIYRRAKEVVAWTGEDLDLAIDFINLLNGLKKSDSALPAAYHIGEAALLDFLARPYWRRVWIIQELALARHVTIHCGRLETSWPALASSIRKLDNCGHNSGIINIKNLAKFRDDAAENRPLKFLEALERSSAAQSTEPRDKVFALLGLVYDSALYIPVPNYRQSIIDICISMTISAMSTTSSLDIIPCLAPFSERSLLPSWCPNWFALDGSSMSRQTDYLLRKFKILSEWDYVRPDFEGNSRNGFRKPLRAVTHLTTAGTEMKFTIAKSALHADTLRLKGLLLDHIMAIIPSHVGNGNGISVVADSSFSGTSKSNPYGTEPELLEAIARSLSCGDPFFRIPTQLLAFFFTCWNERFQDGWFFTATNPTNNHEYARRWVHAAGSLPIQGRSLIEWANKPILGPKMVDWCRNLGDKKMNSIINCLTEAGIEGVAFMSTQNGYVGWAHNRAQPGDSIYLLPGCSVPVVLRHRTDGGYTVVGYAYVHGVMRGEMMKPKSDSKEIKGNQERNWVDLDIY